ncbi:transcriptional regulator [Sinorhizobium meliloti]|uniref:Quorum-sensing antiactivator TraM n=1 Tax=Sinorhizobium meliloti (strain SM11) TaxID=707241 RepID=A4KVQ9_SINMM|nr:transcriptional repressor TraM [Sinorhizobium meliloti]ABN47160.1 putative quorum-sensing antiactivator TraM [Sinorhizobium meliloti SM11]ARS66164.1 transcriptional regulator [Sinorhizobium meliloti RU11/001]MDE3765530.1 transcriptional repressor TraM [Sinorhizobium meliloti]MDE3779308.1 transcriptional repressor TraM [Sinorhizobium meliloti]MDE3804851.1 transcriptional repressor TraM [Sinorhizobium meliloti]
MSYERNSITRDVELPPIVGLLSNESEKTIEILTVGAIKKHRKLLDRAERLFQDVRANERKDEGEPDKAYLAYLDATIEMHAQMSALTTLLGILGRTPKV